MKLYFLLFGIMMHMSCGNNEPSTVSVSDNVDRVEQAQAEKSKYLSRLFKNKGLDFEQPFDVFLRAFKKENILELWAKGENDSRFILLEMYDVCAASGKLGPKRKEGDKQVPEGFYYVNRFNPKSSFHLSLGINYPNKSDLKFADLTSPGSDIFIHGGCVSIGCLAITDDKIKELYLIVDKARVHGQNKTPVHIFPMKMTENNLEREQAKVPVHGEFWQNLKVGFDLFEEERKLPKIMVDESGQYVFN